MKSGNLQLHERLIAERNRLRLTQDEMAVACNAAKRTYCDYESGKSEPRGSFFEALAKAGGDVTFVITGLRSTQTLKPDEAALLDNYRAISDERKHNLVDVAEALSCKQRCEKKAG